MLSEGNIFSLLSKYRHAEAEIKVLRECVFPNVTFNGGCSVEFRDRLNMLEQKIAMIDSWLMLVNAEEAFILKRHLIDGLDWARIAVEHDKLWGVEQGRSERTLKRIQSKALQKILAFINKSFPDMLDGLFQDT